MVRMRQSDQCLRSLLTILPEEINHAVFGHHVMRMRSCRRHCRARFQLKQRTILFAQQWAVTALTVLTIRVAPLDVCEGMTMMGLPCSLKLAPRMKSS